MRPSFFLFPILAAFSASAAAGDVVTLRADGLKAAFDLSDMGGIVSLRHGDAEVVSEDWNSPTVFAIGLVNGNESRYFTNRDFDEFESEKIKNGLRLRYSGLKDRELEIELTIRESNGAIDFKSIVRCGPETICSDLLYPYVSGYESLSGDPEKDNYLLPHLCGQLLTNPARTLREGKSDKLSSSGYPGTQGVQLHALYNDESGITMWTPDAECHPKWFTIHRNKELGGLAWSVQHYFSEVPGFVFEQPYPVRVQASGPAWYDAADIYAAWGRQQWWMEKKKPSPEWFKKVAPLANGNDNEQ